MLSEQSVLQISFTPVDNNRLANLCGHFDSHIKMIEQRVAVNISNRAEIFKISGLEKDIQSAGKILNKLYDETQSNAINKEIVHLNIQEVLSETVHQTIEQTDNKTLSLHTGRGIVKPRGENQANYLSRVLKHDISFGIGPAGTGKTYLAVACAVQALNENQVRRLILTRPAVEAGENLGFLPGDLSQKIDPYLRPLYDALYDMMGYEKVAKLIERNVIEVAPLAYMRGRSLNESFIILDEAQNTTSQQMKMFLTRIGFGSKAIITGDPTQADLPKHVTNGLEHSLKVLKKVKGISFTYFESKDIVRHPLVQRIVNAYEAHTKKQIDNGESE
ncbi:MAG: PhoH family protein [Gammaproteobacteria bacterium]|nr:PhoH family protein [Gammaproteobacteria bacterium]